MIREIIEEIKFIIKHPFISFFIIGMITGILPALVMGILF